MSSQIGARRVAKRNHRGEDGDTRERAGNKASAPEKTGPSSTFPTFAENDPALPGLHHD
jgi:hypothetical protein